MSWEKILKYKKTFFLFTFLILTVKGFSGGIPDIYFTPDPLPNGDIKSYSYSYKPRNSEGLWSSKKIIDYTEIKTDGINKIIPFFHYPQLGIFWYDPDEIQYIYENNQIHQILPSSKEMPNHNDDIFQVFINEDKIELREIYKDRERLCYLFLIDQSIEIDESFLQYVEKGLYAIFLLDRNYNILKSIEFYDFHTISYIVNYYDENGFQIKQEIYENINEILHVATFYFEYKEYDKFDNWTKMLIQKEVSNVKSQYGIIYRHIVYNNFLPKG